MTKVTRRNVLKTGSALVGGMAGILATGRAPAFAQTTTVHWIRWNDFVIPKRLADEAYRIGATSLSLARIKREQLSKDAVVRDHALRPNHAVDSQRGPVSRVAAIE
jgi:hypothetical protein